MPGPVRGAVPIATLPYSLATKFSESHAAQCNINAYHDGSSHRRALVSEGRRAWNLSKRLTPAQLTSLRNFAAGLQGAAFYFYNPSETLPPYANNPIGAAGQYLVRFNNDWSQSNGMLRSDSEIQLIELTTQSEGIPIVIVNDPGLPGGGGGTVGGPPEIDPSSPYSDRILQAWLFPEGSGSTTKESKYGYVATLDTTDVDWSTNGLLGTAPNVHLNGGFPIGSDPGASVFPTNSDPSSGLEVGQFSVLNGPTNQVDPGNFTLLMWVKPSIEYMSTNYPYDASLIFKSDITVTVTDSFTEYHASKGFSLELTRSPEITFTLFSSDYELWSIDWYYPSVDSPDQSAIFGKWTQIVITTDGSHDIAATKLYINGAEVTGAITITPGEDTVVPNYLPDDVAWTLGGTPDAGGPHLATPIEGGAHTTLGPRFSRPLNGQIDNMVIFQGPLTAAEVLDLYNNPYSPWGKTHK